MSKCPALHSVVQLSNKCGRGRIIFEQFVKNRCQNLFSQMFLTDYSKMDISFGNLFDSCTTLYYAGYFDT